MMHEIRLDMPAEATKSRYADTVRYYTSMQDSNRQRSSESTSSTATSAIMDEKQQRSSKRRRYIAAALVITIVALSAFIVTAFLLDFPKFANVDSNNNNIIEQTTATTTSKLVTSTSMRIEDENEIGAMDIKDSNPSGFSSQVDYVLAESSDITAPELGPAQPNVITVSDNMTPELEKQLLAQLYSEFPELFAQNAKEDHNSGQLADMPQLPPGATGFSMHSQPDLDGFKLQSDPHNHNAFVIQSPRQNAHNPEEYDLTEPVVDESDHEDMPPPPPGPWSNLKTPPPPPMEERPKIIFQESAPSLQWDGPDDGTWFHQPIDFIQGEATPKETRISAPWLGDDCTIVTTLTGEKKAEGSDKCDKVVWYPYHYDIYPDSKPADWVYIDMKAGERNLAWPGAGPFRKIDQTPPHSSLRSGPICLDLPPMPFEYRGPIPDELDCASVMMRVKGFGDNKEYVKIDAQMPLDLQKSAWDFAWRQI